MYLDDLEYRFSESTPVEVSNIESVYDEYESNSWEINEGDGRELEERLTLFYSLPVVEQQSPEINKLVYIEGGTKQNEVSIAEDKGIHVLFYASSFATF